MIDPAARFRIAGMKVMDGRREKEINGEVVGQDLGKPVWVQCPGFRCLAYRDGQGNWRTFFQGDVLADAVSVNELAGY